MTMAYLGDGRSSILEVAMGTGFGSLSSFNRHFKAANACSPREWRRAMS